MGDDQQIHDWRRPNAAYLSPLKQFIWSKINCPSHLEISLATWVMPNLDFCNRALAYPGLYLGLSTSSRAKSDYLYKKLSIKNYSSKIIVFGRIGIPHPPSPYHSLGSRYTYVDDNNLLLSLQLMHRPGPATPYTGPGTHHLSYTGYTDYTGLHRLHGSTLATPDKSSVLPIYQVSSTGAHYSKHGCALQVLSGFLP